MGFKTLFSTKRAKSTNYSNDDIEKRNADDPRIQPQHRLLTPFLLDKRIPPIPTEEERIEFPFRETNIISEMFYLWCQPILRTGYRRTIQPEDLYVIKKGSRYDVERRTNVFLDHFYSLKHNVETKFIKRHKLQDTPEVRKSLARNPEFQYPSYLVLLALYKTYFSDYTIAVCSKGTADVAAALNTLQIKALIKYVQQKADGVDVGKKGYGLAVGVAAIVFLFGMLYARNFNDSSFCGAEIKGVLTKVLLDKSFRLNKEAKMKYPPSTVTAYLGNDLSKIDLATNYFPYVCCLPIGLGLTIALLAVNLGGASLSGVAWFILVTTLIVLSTKLLMRWRKAVNIETDGRVKYTKEVLGNIKMIKYYAWEIPFIKIISDLRAREMEIMLKVQFFRNFVTGFAVTLPMFSAMVGFLAMYGQLGGLKNASNVFSSVTLFNILTAHVAMLPTALTSASDAWVAFCRVQTFLLAGEEEPDLEYHKNEFDPTCDVINIQNGRFDWLTSADVDSNSVSLETSVDYQKEKDHLDNSSDENNHLSKFDLHDINLQIKHGEFIVVTGSIGTGKSSLLAAINGVMTRLTGTIDISGDLVLCSAPWIQNTTVRENIIFGLDFDRDVYNTVIECCALPSDFDILPAGDKTEIGERGVNLSGGQKARINLARTVYRAYVLSKQYNIVMFDDVLSAVDAKVGKHIMKECILGLLSDKTRILATHQLSLIGEADRIIYMNGDGTIDIGTNEELMGKNEGFRTLMAFQVEGDEENDEEEEIQNELAKEEDTKLIRKQTTIIDAEKGKLVQAETVRSNGIPKEIVLTYLRTGAGKLGLGFIVPNLILAISLTSFCMIFENVWLSFWTSDKYPDRSNRFYIGIYVMVTVLFVFCAIWQFCTIVYMANRSSRILNIKALQMIMHAPMAFFDTTPMGRIINRFTKDTDVLDNEIAEQARLCCFGFGNMCGILIMCFIFLPWFTIALPFIIGYVFSMFTYYQSTAREVKRIEGVSRSVVFSTFDEVLQGLDTIKLFSATDRFIEKHTQIINKMNEAYLYTISVQRWLAVTLHGCSASINLIIGMLCVSRVYPISGASSGLLISYLVQLSMQLIVFSKSLGQAEQFSSSVERVCEYATELPQEAAYNNEEVDQHIPKNWPSEGCIKFDEVSLRYRPELPFVLKNMTLDIKGGEKIGICGRTGAGKSTIMTALYRLSEIECGQMFIDGVDIQKLGLFKLRSNLAIIPQDPVLFRGTIRRNLDPFEQTEDSVLQNAINLACGSENSEKFSLDTFVEDGGVNFSLGERQVIALCRALIRQSKILILDEATSSVDYETDSRIQHTISNGFKGCTILCIAHRLRTILDYDRILVMDKGELVEFDTPKKLWTQNGIFRSMCDKSGIEESDFN